MLFLTVLGCDYKEYLTSIARKEIEWTRRYGKLIELDCPHNGVFPGVKSRLIISLSLINILH